jgi:hypothetical protein
MKSRFPGFTGVDESVADMISPPTNLLYSENFVLSSKRGTIKKRPGSKHYAVTGDVWGIGGYAKPTSNLKIPIGQIPVRHVRDGSTSTISKFDWEDETWSDISYGSDASSSDLGIGAVSRFIQIGTKMAILSGTPVMIDDISTGTILKLGGAVPTTAPTLAESAGAGDLTGLYSCYYVFFNPTTGWESSPSPIASITVAANKKINWSALPSTYAKVGVTKKRLYRTEVGGGSQFFFVAEIDLATTTYEDDIANLGALGPEIGENDPPPTSCYLGESYANRFFLASGDTLYFSKEFDGSYARLEQFPDINFISLGTNITGLRYNERLGGLLIFKPPGFGIDLLRGTSLNQFEIVPLFSDLGTSFDSSISSRGDSVVFWGASGPVLLKDGRFFSDFGNGLRERLRPYIRQDYNADVFVWSMWHEDTRQFIFSFSGLNTDVTGWVEFDTSLPVSWVDFTTNAEVNWEEHT